MGCYRDNKLTHDFDNVKETAFTKANFDTYWAIIEVQSVKKRRVLSIYATLMPTRSTEIAQPHLHLKMISHILKRAMQLCSMHKVLYLC